MNLEYLQNEVLPKMEQELRAKKIREMKKPTILMSGTDFEIFKNEIESKNTIVVGNNPTYQGVPIKTSQIIEKGNIVVYDDVCSCYICGESIEQPEEQYNMYGEMVCRGCWDYNMYQEL